MAGDFSVADAMALTKGAGSADGFGGTWTWVFFLFFLLAWGGNGMFGNNSGVNNAATQGAITRAELYDSNFAQDTFRNFGELNAELTAFQNQTTNALDSIRYESLKNSADLAAQIAQNRYAADSANCMTNRNIDAAKFELSRQNCDGIQKIADMLTADKIDTLRSELEAARNQISNLMQSNNIINQVRPFPTPAYIVSSPYGTGCNCGASMTYGY